MAGNRSNRWTRGAAILAAAALLLAAARLDWQHYVLTKLPNRPVDCPSGAYTIVVFGQSDAANTGDTRRVGPPGSFYFADGDCHRLRDPVAGGSGGGGSIWPALASRLDRPVVVVSGAVGGASIDELGGEPLRRLLVNVAAAEAKGLGPDLTIFMQGDTDAVKRTPAPHYLSKLRDLRRALPGRWIVTEGDFCTPEHPETELASARRRLAASDPQVTVGPNLDGLGLDYRRADRCHFNRRGLDRVADLLADELRQPGTARPAPAD